MHMHMNALLEVYKPLRTHVKMQGISRKPERYFIIYIFINLNMFISAPSNTHI